MRSGCSCSSVSGQSHMLLAYVFANKSPPYALWRNFTRQIEKSGCNNNWTPEGPNMAQIDMKLRRGYSSDELRPLECDTKESF